METLSGWFIKDRVIIHRPVGDETLSMIKKNNDALIKLLDQGTPKVHVIVDARYIKKLPTSLLKLNKATTFLSHSSLGWVITISNNSLITFLGGMLPQLGSLTHYRVVSEPEDGLTFLKDQDTSLDWSTANHDLIAS